MIRGTKSQVRALREIIDTDNRLPAPGQGRVCKCGASEFAIESYDDRTVRCASCKTVHAAGDLGVTMTTVDDAIDAKTGEYVILDTYVDSYDDEIKSAKSKDPSKRNEREAKLATLPDITIEQR